MTVFVLLGALTEVPADGISFAPYVTVVQWLLGGVIALLLVLPAVFTGPTGKLPNRLLSARPVVWLGLVSYGIFLWEMGPLTAIVNDELISGDIWILRFAAYAAVVLVVTVPLAALSYHVVERPFLRLKDPGRRRSPGPTPASRSGSVDNTWGP